MRGGLHSITRPSHIGVAKNSEGPDVPWSDALLFLRRPGPLERRTSRTNVRDATVKGKSRTLAASGERQNIERSISTKRVDREICGAEGVTGPEGVIATSGLGSGAAAADRSLRSP